MKTKFRVFTALLLALMVLVSVLPLQAAAEIGQSGTATRAEAENTAEAALSVKPMLTPSYTPSASYRSGKYYTQLCNVSLTGNQRTDLVNVARSQLGYHEGNNTANFTVNQAAQATIPNTAIGTARRFRGIPEDRITHGAHILSAGAQDRRASPQASSATLPMHVRAATTAISRTLIIMPAAAILPRLVILCSSAGKETAAAGIMLKLLLA